MSVTAAGLHLFTMRTFELLHFHGWLGFHPKVSNQEAGGPYLAGELSLQLPVREKKKKYCKKFFTLMKTLNTSRNFSW